MASLGDWWAGARPRTLPAALAPVAVGAGVAVPTSEFDYRLLDLLLVSLCAIVALALQVGVNYANDYSDGIRGTDQVRVGPVRLVGQQLAEPQQVKKAALLCFAIAAAAGLTLVVLSGQWWLIPVGVLAIAAAWLYTGGPKPYGYAGLGEVMVFLFFGVVAVVGTASVLSGRISALAIVVSIPVGLLACALLVVNNLRDIQGDALVGKRTLATRIGEKATRLLFVALVWVPFVIVAGVGIIGVFTAAAPASAAIALITFPLAASPARAVRNGATGPALIEVLGATARLELFFCLLLAIGLSL